MLYLQVTSLLTRQPEAVTDWRAHFYSQRLWFFGVDLVLIFIAIGLSLILGAGPLAGQFGIARLLVIALSVAGLATTNERAHAIIVALWATSLVFGFWAQAFTPLAEAP
jgi:hypothetical protein